MIEKITISPETLFYIGTQVAGEHIDYIYISLMKDISKNRKYYEQKCIEELQESNYISENMWGDVCIDDNVKKFLHPVFWGKNEASVEILYPREQNLNYEWLFHNDNKETVQVSYNNGLLNIITFNKQLMDSFIFCLMPNGYNDLEKPLVNKLDLNNITRIIKVRSYCISGQYSEYVLFEIEGLLCEVDEESNCIVLSPKQFYEKMDTLLSWKMEA